jgi:hypothetical protein
MDPRPMPVVLDQVQLNELEHRAHLSGWISGFITGVALIPLGSALGTLAARIFG